jgi:superfamily II DNA/RNA helicase
MSANVEDVAKNRMRDPLRVMVKLTLEAIKQNYITVEKEELKLCLCNMQ